MVVDEERMPSAPTADKEMLTSYDESDSAAELLDDASRSDTHPSDKERSLHEAKLLTEAKRVDQSDTTNTISSKRQPIVKI